jgi:hypothetical protein
VSPAPSPSASLPPLLTLMLNPTRAPGCPQLRDDCLSYAPRLFIEDGALGSNRGAELRVRIVTDSPVVALYFRNMLHRVPLYGPEAFPRTVTAYVGTLASGPAFSAVDVDPTAARGTVLAAGPVALAALREALATAAGQLQTVGGYRHVHGGDANPNIKAARGDGLLDWYMADRHWYAEAGEPHPDLLPLRADYITAGGEGGGAVVIGSATGAVAGAAAAKGRLYAAHNIVWQAGGVAAQWAGLSIPKAAQAGAKSLALTRGCVVAQGAATLPFSAPKSAAAPARVIVIDAAGGAGDAAKVKAAAGLSDKQAEKLATRLSGVSVSVVASEADALKALGL